jgi:hypothetical protein
MSGMARSTASARLLRPARGNLGQTTLKLGRRRGDPMAEFDRLPAPVRRWLTTALLPWSPRSVGRAWRQALLRHGHDHLAALADLARMEYARIERDRAALLRRGSLRPDPQCKVWPI